MVVVIGVLAVVGGLIVWLLRAQGAARAVRDLDRDTQGIRRRIRHAVQDFRAHPLRRIDDPRLAATILMIQLVRAEGHMSADEKVRILAMMERRLGLSPPEPMFETAWTHTEASRPFSIYADDLLPLLRDSLYLQERYDLVEMLGHVAHADGPPSELQEEAVTRLRKRMRS